ncbi:MAG: cobyric acid synthase [Roseburia sp.]|nr:cobyric acid synthase [Roseburia sp.]MCM1097840.1 cobyric acid synthase [Ruminococcus flavefaciens]
MAKSIMIQGTMSNVGKSLIAAGLCRVFRQDGYRVAPFKSQNMALNSFITRENLEIGRAQAVQAAACGIEPLACMNPILLKPTTDMGSQVIVNGEVVGNMRAMDYFRRKREYIPVIREAYEKLAARYDIVVIEGAGSPAEINLKADDIVNMGMAEIADAPVLLVGDIDRGGVFAQLIGTVMLLEKKEQERVKGLVINKFRGDKRILEPGLDMITERCGKEILGVVPWLDVDIEEEDSLAESLGQRAVRGTIDVAVLRLPKISNFTDFQALGAEPDVSVRYVEKASELRCPDLVCIPGTKNTISDMKWLRAGGLEAAVKRLAEKGTPVIGICGGYQMLGSRIVDACGAEGGGQIRGLGLLPMVTYYEPEKRRRQNAGAVLPLTGVFEELSGKDVRGYEIHMGRSVREEPDGEAYETGRDSAPSGALLRLEDGLEGCCRGNVFGSYLHGIFDEEEFRTALIQILYRRKGMVREEERGFSMEAYREEQFDRLADALRRNLDLDAVYRIAGLPGRKK